MAKAKQAEAPAETEATEVDLTTKVKPLHEAHAAYIKEEHGVDVDPLHIFLVYSTRVPFRKTSEQYQESKAALLARKEEEARAKEEAKAQRAKEREEKAAAKKAEKEQKAAEAKAAKEAKAKEDAAKEAKVTKSSTAKEPAKKAAASSKKKPF